MNPENLEPPTLTNFFTLRMKNLLQKLLSAMVAGVWVPQADVSFLLETIVSCLELFFFV